MKSTPDHIRTDVKIEIVEPVKRGPAVNNSELFFIKNNRHLFLKGILFLNLRFRVHKSGYWKKTKREQSLVSFSDFKS